MSSDIRVCLLQMACDQMRGQELRIFDPTDFYFLNGGAMPVYDQTDGVVAFFPPHPPETVERSIAVYGPYIDVEPGRWRVEFRNPDDSTFVYEGAGLEVVRDADCKRITELVEWPSDGSIEFEVQEKAEYVQFRIYRTWASAEFAYCRLERVRLSSGAEEGLPDIR
jgi:hypothetical protein